MRANVNFRYLDKQFWAYVRSISQQLGYTNRQTKQIRVYSIDDMIRALHQMGLSYDQLVVDDEPTELGTQLQAYFAYRTDVLNTFVERSLMNEAQAAKVFNEYRMRLNPSCPLPLNKQKGEKKAFAYLTGLVNMLIEANIHGLPCDFDPQHLTTVTRDNRPLRTLARRVDGCFPTCVNPIAVWEIKEYYYTTTFGSRVADGVYETLLDGLELEELENEAKIHIEHVLMIDAYDTWWIKGRSYLCRLIDMLNMGYVDEILFGREVVDRLPTLVQEWVAAAHERGY